MSATVDTQEAPPPPAPAAAAEILRRQRSRASLLEYARSVDIPGAPDPSEPDPEKLAFTPIETSIAHHHRLMLEAIERCINRSMGRLIIMAPPGSAKSSYASVVGTTWLMGRTPKSRVIIASYASDIAEKQARKCRALVKEDLYRSIWKEQPELTEKAVGEWAMTNGSELMAAGLLAGITGNRADLIVIDDPVANREDADSPTMREKTYNEYLETATSRLKPHGSLVLIMTHWHEDDLAGRILPVGYAGENGMLLCQDNQMWEVLCIPAKAEREDDPLGRAIGEYLWPEWFPTAHWHQWENNPRARRMWSALCQQRPSPAEGIQFSEAMFKRFDLHARPGALDGPPVALRMYGASDYATKDEADKTGPGDFTEHGVAGMDAIGDLWFTHWWSGQRETDKSIAAFIQLVQLIRHFHLALGKMVIRWWNEGGPIDKAIKPAINRAMREARPAGSGFVSCEAMTSIKAKEIKLLSFHARAMAGTVHVPRTEWGDKVIAQLIAFPAGKHDDKCDVCGLLGRGIDEMGAAALPSPEERPVNLTPFTAKWLEYTQEEKPAVRYFS